VRQFVLLDSGPLGQACRRYGVAATDQCKFWIDSLVGPTMDGTCTTKEGREIPALANRPETRRDLSLNLRPLEWGFVELRHRVQRPAPARYEMGQDYLHPRATANVLALRCMSLLPEDEQAISRLLRRRSMSSLLTDKAIAGIHRYIMAQSM
jgi:hypothetical protein